MYTLTVFKNDNVIKTLEMANYQENLLTYTSQNSSGVSTLSKNYEKTLVFFTSDDNFSLDDLLPLVGIEGLVLQVAYDDDDIKSFDNYIYRDGNVHHSHIGGTEVVITFTHEGVASDVEEDIAE